MTVTQRLKKAHVKVNEAKLEVADLLQFVRSRYVTRVTEARALSTMEKQLTAIAARLENMAKKLDAL